MNNYYILTFQNTHGSISGESILKKQNIKIEIMPTPTSITKSCGISIKINEEHIEEVKDLIKKGVLNVKNIYVKEGAEYKVFEI